MTDPAAGGLLDDLFESAPCGYLTTTLDGQITRANRTLADLAQVDQAALQAGSQVQDLLSVGARLYYETHLMPRLLMHGSVSEVALELRRADGARIPALVNANLRRDTEGRPVAIRLVVVAADQRREYEEHLLRAQRNEHAVARELQHSLLAGDLPVAPQLELAIGYRASERGLTVGGDWYDAFWLNDARTRVGLVVGDVVGRGLQAAATMGQLRSAVRAFATVGDSPAQLLSLLDAYVRRHEVGVMTTLVYAELDLAEATLRYACGGHPPPLVAAPGLEPRLLWDGRSQPLAALSRPSGTRSEGLLQDVRGSTVLFYSDGLTERHADRSIDGQAALVDDVSRLVMIDPDGLVRELSHLERDSHHSDDLCLLAVRLS